LLKNPLDVPWVHRLGLKCKVIRERDFANVSDVQHDHFRRSWNFQERLCNFHPNGQERIGTLELGRSGALELGTNNFN
jgi:hypothetical protein